ncbi:MAG: rRNA maturation RNase YbeY [Chloroflexi bacterium]|nr:rRNA maturation RNase YbeY [Chloroflexota bacterium]
MPSEARVDLHIDDRFLGLVSEATVRRAAELAMKRERRAGPAHASIAITGDDVLRRLNREFRGDDKVTDVLSFGSSSRAREGRVEPSDFPAAPGERPSLGDVIISYPQAERQARAAGHSVERELALLAAHGILHLLGFDHVEIEEERVMFAKQDAILAEVLGSSLARDRS